MKIMRMKETITTDQNQKKSIEQSMENVDTIVLV